MKTEEEIIITTILMTVCWALLGAFINWKRDYYKHLNTKGVFVYCIVNYLFAPIAIIVSVVAQISTPWTKE